jgi:hypothetical protein
VCTIVALVCSVTSRQSPRLVTKWRMMVERAGPALIATAWMVAAPYPLSLKTSRAACTMRYACVLLSLPVSDLVLDATSYSGTIKIVQLSLAREHSLGGAGYWRTIQVVAASA